MVKVKGFRFGGQWSLSRSLGQNCWHDQKGLITRNVHVKYQSSISTVLPYVKVFRKWNKGQGHKVIHLGVIWKGFISWGYMPNMKSLSLTVQKLWPRLKFCATFESQWQTGQKLYAPKFHSEGINICIIFSPGHCSLQVDDVKYSSKFCTIHR